MIGITNADGSAGNADTIFVYGNISTPLFSEAYTFGGSTGFPQQSGMVTGSNQAAIPEPATMLLAFIGIILFSSFHRFAIRAARRMDERII